jgi:hypothetical protein
MTDQQPDHVPGGLPEAPTPGQPMSEDAYLAMVDPPGADEGPQPVPQPKAPAEAQRPSDGLDGLREAATAIKEAAEPAQAAQQTVDAEWTAARELVQRYSSPEIASALSREHALAMSKKLGKIQSDFDQMHTDLRQFKAQAKPPENPSAVATPAGQQPAVEGQPRPDLKAVSAKLTEVLGLDSKDGQILETALQAITEPLRHELDARATRDRARDQVVAELYLERARRRLEGQFPGLADDAAFEPIAQETLRLLQTGARGNVLEAMQSASKEHFFAVAQQDAAAQASKLAASKARGSPAPPAPRTPPQALSQSDRDELWLQAFEGGATEQEASAVAGY